MKRNKKVYILSSHGQTGGIECLHQLCDELNRSGLADASIVYIQMYRWEFGENYWWGEGLTRHGKWEEGNMEVPFYSDKYGHLKSSPTVVLDEEDCDVTVVIPEIVDGFRVRLAYPYDVRVIMWWLSWDNASKHNRMRDAWTGIKVEHAFQSRYAQERAECELGIVGSFLPHYIIVDDATRTAPARSIDVAYNPAKDDVTPRVCREMGLTTLPIKGMTRDQVFETLANRVKVYVDFGTHPGIDRLPCEAAAMGCVVITNRRGSAGNEEDVPIAEKCDTHEELSRMLPKVLKDLEGYRNRQEVMRKRIRGDRATFVRKVEAIFGSV